MGRLQEYFFGKNPDRKTVRSNFWAGVSFIIVVVIFTLVLVFG